MTRCLLIAWFLCWPVAAWPQTATARAVAWGRVRIVEYELLANGKYESVARWERRATYKIGTNLVSIVAGDSDADELKALKAKTGKTLQLDNGRVKP